MLWLLFHWFTFFFVILIQIIGIIVAIHALMHKKNPRSALGWMAICIGVPAVGVILYLLFGVNRIALAAKHWESRGRWRIPAEKKSSALNKNSEAPTLESSNVIPDLKTTGDHVCDYPLIANCSVKALFDGTEAYPAMLQAIDDAKESVYLSTYIFCSRAIGHEFIQAIVAATHRGVDVKILIDGIGALYTFPTAYRKLKNQGVRVALFLRPFRSLYHTVLFNLRNHRKLLIIDGKLAFTGGMNIRRHHLRKEKSSLPKVRDIQYCIRGPVVGQLQDVFLKDWYFNTKESPKKVVYYDNSPQGESTLRTIASGPQQPYFQLQVMLCAALSSAKSSIRVMTPYFVPDESLISAINTASLRGIHVDIILPAKNNLFFVKGAAEALLPELLQNSVNFYYRPGAFSHIKLFLVDHTCAFIGSSNLDARSLRLNFELDLEIYDRNLCKALNQYFQEIKDTSTVITQELLQSRAFLVRLRNSFYKLFSPYL